MKRHHVEAWTLCINFLVLVNLLVVSSVPAANTNSIASSVNPNVNVNSIPGPNTNNNSNNSNNLNPSTQHIISSSSSSSNNNTANTATSPLAKEKTYEKCTGPGDPGPCKHYQHKWRFEPTTLECNTFIWGGCEGNSQNRFDTETECLYRCIGAPHTLPPYLLQTTTKEPSTTEVAVAGAKSNTPPPKHYEDPSHIPVPFELRGPELTFAETGHEKTFFFAKNNTFIQMDGDIIQTFQLRLCREISFQFRTRLPHGLLVYHNVKNPDGINLDPYALYVIVEKGQLKVVHVFGKHSTSVTVGEGLNRDEWHSVMVRIDVHGARLIARIDTQQEEVYLKGLNHDTNYGVSTNLPSVVLVGGLSSEEKLHGVKYIIESFVGCIRNVVLSSGKAASDLLPITPLVATKHENVNEGCSNKCHSRQNLCFVGSRCINHFYGISCDCFGTHYEGEHCDIYTATIMTLRGASYVSYRIYDWKDRVHSSTTRISMMFRTRHDDSALFYASGEALKHQYIAASLKNKSIHVEMDFGDSPQLFVIPDELTRSYWHNLTIYHEQRNVKIILDQQTRTYEIPTTTSANLLFDPEIYFGGGPDLHKKKGLASHNNFVGILKYVYYNDVSILYELKKGNPKVHYHGILEAEFQENEVHVIPITYPFATSHIWWPINQAEEFNIKFDFRSSRTAAVLAYSDVTTSAGNGFWEIRLTADKLSFDLVPDVTNDTTLPTVIKINRPTSWHSVELDYRAGEITFRVDYRHTLTVKYGMTFIIGDKVIIGSSLKSAASGLVGCIRDIEINGHLIEPRDVIKTERVVGEVAVDNCNYIDPCKRPNTCEHGGKCFVRDNQVTCDCKDTGYIGKNCHFTKYRKTCEELALLSYTKSDVYLIDIDGNGVFPPAHVKCDFQSLENATKTIVEHNLPSQIDVRKANDIDFSYNIRYREFSPEMLQELISHSLYCTQYIKYDCYRAPLELHSATWFTSSSNNNTVDFLGNVKRGACPCSDNKTCVDPNQSCNCDVKENKWYSDEGYYTEPHSLGITNMFFRQQKDLDEEAKGRITLGPLECVETNTQKYVVTFTTSQSYIEVPGWRKGDIAFSFRTTGEKAILLFQPPIRPSYPSFVVALTGDYQLTFNFTLSTGESRTLVIDSVRKFNGGEWHKIWIDYNEYHVRFMINTDYKMVDLLPEQEFGPFEGSMFIGGATGDLLKKLIVKQGLIGCFRGLVVNGEILDIYSYMSVHLSEIIKDCKPSCVPSPCKNDAECKELWSTFECVCSNPWAHLGEFCETNINEKALTFINRESFLKRNFLSTNTFAEDKRGILKNILSQDILINLRTYDKHSLVLYANDHFNNFVHLFISEGKEIVFLYNYGDEIVNLTVVDESISRSLKSIQVAIIRSPKQTVMHVNERNVTVEKGTLLLDEYANKPWINPEKEVLSPHRPPAPPRDYFQFNIGGYDPANLLRTNTEFPELQGYIGCVRGLKIGKDLIDLAELNERNIAHALEGVLPSCQLKCDAEPCKNGGFCKENFAKQESTCDCENTSFLGEFCMEEKGADFSGESILQRKFELTGKVNYVKLQLAFSSADLKRANRVMLLLQTNNERSYYLMVAIDTDGYLLFEEDREDGSAVGAHIERTFLKGARHSIYYHRNGTEASLLIDREQVTLAPITIRPLMQNVIDSGANRVQIGGINTTDSRFAVFKSYSGCLSNIYIQVNNYIMKPLEEYMLFTKSGADNITVINFQGVRSAQCAAQFEHIPEPRPQEPILNITMVSGQNWVEEAPVRVPYVAKHIDVSTKEEQTQVVFITLIALFVIIVICCLLEVYRSHLEYKKRIERETDEDIIWSKEQATKMQQSPGNQTKTFNYKPLPQTEQRKASTGAPLVGILKNGTTGGQPKPTENTNGTLPREKEVNITPPAKIEEVDEEVEHQAAKKPEPNEINQTSPPTETSKDPESLTDKKPEEVKKDDKPKGPLIPGVRDSQLMDAELKWDPLPENSNEEPLLDGSVTNSIAGDSDSDTSESPTRTTTTAASATKTSQNPQKVHVKFDNQPSARPRSRQVSWGPPPVAQDNVNQLPFKIDESADDIDTEDDQKSTEIEIDNASNNDRRSQNALTTTNGHCSPTLDNETSLLLDMDTIPSAADGKSPNSNLKMLPLSEGIAPIFSASTEDLSTLDGSMSPLSQHQIQIPTTSPNESASTTAVEISNIPIAPFVTKPNPKTNAAPVFIDESRRQFSNPISYIGGPRLEPRNRNSIESVLSLD